MNEPGRAPYSKLISRSAFIFAIRFFPAAATLAVAILFAHKLPKSVNGFYQEFWIDVTVFQALAFFGLPALILTHTAESVRKWFSSLRPAQIVLAGVWMLLVTAAFLYFLDPSGKYNRYILGTLFLIQALCLLFESIGMVQQRYRILALNSFFYSLLFLLAHLLVFEGILRFKTLFPVLLVLQIARLLSYSGIIRSVFQKNPGVDARDVSTRQVRRQWRDLGTYDVLQISARWLDKLIVARIVSPALFSIYAYGTTDIPFVALLLGAAGTALLQQMALGSGTKQEKLKMVRYSGSVLARLVFPVFFFLLFFRTEFIEALFSASYLKAVPLFAISICTLPLRSYSFTTLLQHYNRVSLINLGAVLDLIVSLGLVYPLHRWLGLQGIALAFVIGTYVQAAFYLFATSRIMRCSISSLIPVRTWLVCFVGFALAGWICHETLSFLSSSVLRLISGLAIMALLAGLSLLRPLGRKLG